MCRDFRSTPTLLLAMFGSFLSSEIKQDRWVGDPLECSRYSSGTSSMLPPVDEKITAVTESAENEIRGASRFASREGLRSGEGQRLDPSETITSDNEAVPDATMVHDFMLPPRCRVTRKQAGPVIDGIRRQGTGMVIFKRLFRSEVLVNAWLTLLCINSGFSLDVAWERFTLGDPEKYWLRLIAGVPWGVSAYFFFEEWVKEVFETGKQTKNEIPILRDEKKNNQANNAR